MILDSDISGMQLWHCDNHSPLHSPENKFHKAKRKTNWHFNKKVSLSGHHQSHFGQVQ